MVISLLDSFLFVKSNIFLTATFFPLHIPQNTAADPPVPTLFLISLIMCYNFS